jgi:hypothetical protein
MMAKGGENWVKQRFLHEAINFIPVFIALTYSAGPVYNALMLYDVTFVRINIEWNHNFAYFIVSDYPPKTETTSLEMMCSMEKIILWIKNQ